MRQTRRKRTGGSGFSTLELTIVLVIAMIVSVLAFPTMEEVMKTYRHSTATNILVADLRLARFEAVKRNESVRVRVVNPTSYILEREADGSWENLRPAVDFSERYWTRGITVTGDLNPAIFYGNGQAEEAISFSVSCTGEESNQVLVTTTGMVRQE